MEYILASASPRRKELLALVLPSFEVIPATSEEKVNISLFPEQMVCSVAEHKCDEVFKTHRDKTVIGCDTVVIFEGDILAGSCGGKSTEYFEVWWSEASCGFVAGRGERMRPNMNQATVGRYEIAGNIHDGQEIL